MLKILLSLTHQITMENCQDKNKNMENDDGEIIDVENDENIEKKPTFRYRRLYDDVRQKSPLKKTMAFFKTWSWLLTSVLLLVLILFMSINYFEVICIILY